MNAHCWVLGPSAPLMRNWLNRIIGICATCSDDWTVACLCMSFHFGTFLTGKTLVSGKLRVGRLPQQMVLVLYPKRIIPKVVWLWEWVMWIPIILSSWFLIEGVEGPGTWQCTFVPPCLCTHAHAPFPRCARPCFAFFCSHAHVCSIPACLSVAPRHMFLQVSAAPLWLMFVRTSAASSGSFIKRTIGAEIVPHFIVCSILGLPCARGFPTPSWLVKKKWNDYLAFFMFVLLT
jgi:hypothetical protein